MSTEVDIIELLERDHRRIDRLADRLDSTADVDEVRSLYEQLVEALLAHEAIEHEVLFPALRGMFAVRDDTTVDAMMAEHHELNSLLAEMRDLDPSRFAFIKLGSALLLEVEGHFAREEESVFALVRAAFQPADLIRLGQRAIDLKNATSA